MKNFSFFLPLFLLLLFYFPACRSFEKKGDSIDRIFAKYSTKNGPGCAVAVIQNGRVIFKKGYGMASLEYGIPVTTASVFDIASVSKQFTGLAISTLIQQGKISPDDDIRKYLPDVPQYGKTITIRHLLHHISGIRDWPQTLNVAGWRFDEVFSFTDIMRMVKYQKDLDFEPGAKYSYSNTGYNLLAAIVEKTTGKTFREWTDENIFRPLQMGSSHFQDDYTRIINNPAYSYEREGDGFRKIPGELTAFGSSSLFTSVDDLCKWVIHFQQCIDSGDPVYKRMLGQGILNSGDTVHYGYGLATGEDRGLKTISHTGGWQGYRTIILNYPDEKFSVIILSNAADFDSDDHAYKTAAIFLKDRFKNAKGKTGGMENLPTIKPDTALLKKYAGTWLLGPGWTVTLTVENGQMMTQGNGEDKFPMDAKTDSSFWIDAYHASMTFVKDKEGNSELLKYKNNQAKKIIPWIPNPKAFFEYAGKYYSDELETGYTVDTAGGKLRMHHMRLGDFDLSPDSSGPDSFSGNVGFIVFTRDDHQQVNGFKLSGGRVKNLRFDKK